MRKEDMGETKLDSLELFREVNRTFPNTKEIQVLKEQGGKVFGWLCTYVPEEIIIAAGALPIRITGYNQEVELEDGNAYLYINNCSFSRSCLQMGLRGEYAYLDGVIGGSTCDGARRLFDLWRYYIDLPFSHILTVPRKYTDEAHKLYYEQVLQFKEAFEKYLNITITDEALLKSITVLNESRELLKKLYELRKLPQPPITGTETMEVLNASFRMPKEQFNQYLKQLLQELDSSDIKHSCKARLMVTGSVMNNPEFIKSIEDLGALVVTDELCSSTRYWSDPVILDGRPPLEAISRRYLNNFPCARMVPSDGRFDRIIELVKDYKVDGVISQIIRYCVPYAHDLPLITSKLKEINTPTLSLDVEYGTSGSGQIRTRVQAFLEMLETKRK
ncbi:MAG: 2-hydroxyacyl-CoA dehydratase [Dehalococcoidales bacterium]|nr:2-hydroxyacyl-CoA dehydratase [Dehalococcoidales bacterium]